MICRTEPGVDSFRLLFMTTMALRALIWVSGRRSVFNNGNRIITFERWNGFLMDNWENCLFVVRSRVELFRRSWELYFVFSLFPSFHPTSFSNPSSFPFSHFINLLIKPSLISCLPFPTSPAISSHPSPVPLNSLYARKQSAEGECSPDWGHGSSHREAWKWMMKYGRGNMLAACVMSFEFRALTFGSRSLSMKCWKFYVEYLNFDLKASEDPTHLSFASFL